MPDIALQRGDERDISSVRSLFKSAEAPHAGLWLSRGLAEWKDNPTKKGEDFQQHVAKAARIPCPEIYQKAYARWTGIVLGSPGFAYWAGKLEGRLFMGMGGPSVLECAITLSRTYGVPVIPASAVKGLVSAYTRGRIDENTRVGLFGRAGDDPEACESGYVVFHDAWWIPDSKPTPLVAEVVTVHHPKYYQSGGETDATDFDSPNPNPQVAARGSFLFAVECAAPIWAQFARDHLVQALKDWGIGGKTAAGYGYFVADKQSQSPAAKKLDEWIQALASEHHSKPEEILRGKALAERWRSHDDPALKTAVLAEIKARWDENGWWVNPPGKSARQAKHVYEAS